MIRFLVENWWTFLIRGVIAILFGLAAIIWPSLTVTILVFVFGAYVIVDGIFSIAVSIMTRKQNDQWWVGILLGIAAIIIGIWAMLFPDLTAIGLVYFIGAWWLVSGILEIIFAIRVRKEIENEWFLILGGVISVIAGALFMLFPGSGAISLIWIIGLFAIFLGVMFVVLAFRLRGLRDDIDSARLA